MRVSCGALLSVSATKDGAAAGRVAAGTGIPGAATGRGRWTGRRAEQVRPTHPSASSGARA